MENSLPKGWEETKLSSLVTYKKGKKPKRMENFPFKSSVPYLDIKAIEKGGDSIFVDPESSNLTNDSELLIVWDGARAGWVGKSRTGAIGSTIMALTPKINRDYLFRFLQTQFDYIQTNHRGTGIPHVDPNLLWNIKVPVAPLAEQQRIVAKLDELMERIDRSQTRLERIPKILKRFRQSVLSAAVSGKLTEEWRERNRIVDSWRVMELKDVIVDKPKNGYSAKPVSHKTRFRVLTLTATTSGRFNSDHFKYFEEPIANDSQFWLQPNDILVQRGNTLEYVGVSAIYDGAPNQFIYPDLMMRLRVNELVSTKYLYYFLSAESARNYLRERATGTSGNMPKINQPTLMGVPILLPSLREQKEIVQRVEHLFSLIDKIDLRCRKANDQTEKLTGGVLAKAFRGELVPQDENDEPASVLLERIRVEKGLLSDKKSKRTEYTEVADLNMAGGRKSKHSISVQKEQMK